MGELEQTVTFEFDFFVVFEDERKNRIKIFGSDKYVKFKQMQIDCGNYPYEVNTGRHFEVLEKFKVAYFTNALSGDDYLSPKHGYLYDASVGGRMYCLRKENHEM